MSEAPRSEYSRELTWPVRFPEEQLRSLRPAGVRSDAEKHRVRGRHRTPPPARPYIGLLQEPLMQHTSQHSEGAGPENSASSTAAEELGAQWETWAQMTMQALDQGEPPPSPPRCALGPQDAPPEVLRVVEAAATAAAALTRSLGGSRLWPCETQAACEYLDAGSDWSSEASSRRTAIMDRSASRRPRGTNPGYSPGAGRGRWRRVESAGAPKVPQRWHSAPRVLRSAGGDFHDPADLHGEIDTDACHNQDCWATAVSSNGWHVPLFQISRPHQQQYQQLPQQQQQQWMWQHGQTWSGADTPKRWAKQAWQNRPQPHRDDGSSRPQDTHPSWGALSQQEQQLRQQQQQQQQHIDPPPRPEFGEDPLLLTGRLEKEVQSLRQALTGNGVVAGGTRREPGLLDFSNQPCVLAGGHGKGLPGHGQGVRTDDGAPCGKENLSVSRISSPPGIGTAGAVGSDLHAVLDRLDVECAKLADVLGVDTHQAYVF